MRIPEEEDEAAEQVSVNLVREGFGLNGEERRLKQLDCWNKGEDFHPKPLYNRTNSQVRISIQLISERERESEGKPVDGSRNGFHEELEWWEKFLSLFFSSKLLPIAITQNYPYLLHLTNTRFSIVFCGKGRVPFTLFEPFNQSHVPDIATW